jgi:hypothetical protein
MNERISLEVSYISLEIIAVKNLIAKRNHCASFTKDNMEMVAAFDMILKTYYLTEEEFQKYVINGEKLKQ